MTNGDKLPICVAPGCGNSKIDVNPWNSHIKRFYPFGCWSWSLLRKAGGGAIATIGGTGIGFLREDETSRGVGAWSYMGPRFFYEYGVNGRDILGEIWRNVISAYLDEFPVNWSTPSADETTPEPDAVSARTVQEYILLGDPSLKIGGYDPKDC